MAKRKRSSYYVDGITTAATAVVAPPVTSISPDDRRGYKKCRLSAMPSLATLLNEAGLQAVSVSREYAYEHFEEWIAGVAVSAKFKNNEGVVEDEAETALVRVLEGIFYHNCVRKASRDRSSLIGASNQVAAIVKVLTPHNPSIYRLAEHGACEFSAKMN